MKTSLVASLASMVIAFMALLISLLDNNDKKPDNQRNENITGNYPIALPVTVNPYAIQKK